MRYLWIAVITMMGVGVATGSAQQTKPAGDKSGVAVDWSSRQVMLTNAAPPSVRALAQQEPRLVLKWLARTRANRQVNSPRPGDRLARPFGKKNRRQQVVDWSVSLGAGSVAPGMSPAMYTFDVNATPDCNNDFVVYALNVAGSASQANLVAFNQVYRGPASGLCGTGDPDVRWAYNTGEKIVTSPVLSLDGTKVAFVESGPDSATFKVLTWAAGQGSIAAPAVPASIVSVPYAAVTNSYSSPWVDYAHDVAYVGADDGKLYKITGVFRGTPALAGAPWPVTVSGGLQLSAPVVEFVSGKIFVGDSAGVLKAVDAATGTLSSNTLLVGSSGLGGSIVDPAIVASGHGTVFAFSGNDGTGAVVVQADLQLTELARARVGRGGASGTLINLHTGAFDNEYYDNPSTGSLLVCGTLDSSSPKPALYSFGFSGITLVTSPASGPIQLGNSAAECSPLTEMFNPNITPNKDNLFVGVAGQCVTGQAGGCVMGWDITSGLGGAPTAAVAESGGTSAIVIDNISSADHASSIYFSTLGPTKNAVKLTQANLQ